MKSTLNVAFLGQQKCCIIGCFFFHLYVWNLNVTIINHKTNDKWFTKYWFSLYKIWSFSNLMWKYIEQSMKMYLQKMGFIDNKKKKKWWPSSVMYVQWSLPFLKKMYSLANFTDIDYDNIKRAEHFLIIFGIK